MGYLNMPEQTADALDANGLLHTGDLAKIDADGFLYITGTPSALLNWIDLFEKLILRLLSTLRVKNHSSISHYLSSFNLVSLLDF